QQKFDVYGNRPSMKLLSREPSRTRREFHDGRLRVPKPQQMGVQIPCLGTLARPSGLGRKSACPNLTCGNFSDVPSLEASEFELIRTWLARPVWARDGT